MSTLKLYKPTTPSRRKSSRVDYKNILTTNEPFKKLTIRKSRTGGRSRGKITVRHIGGGARKMIRLVNFKRNFPLGFKIKTIEYDPNRTAFISLVTDLNSGDNHYILHNNSFEVGKSYNLNSDLEAGNQVELGSLPVGSLVSEVELQPGQGAKVVRSAGNYAEVTAKEEEYTTLKLPSGEIRKFLNTCKGVIGRIGNTVHEFVRIGKAGSTRLKGTRPTVRGKVMNPVDHPHGGGEARNSIGLKYPKTPWGKHALGVKTRNKKKNSSKVIIQRRKKK
jgi:large subunit ribosomal protein L2